MNVVPVISRLLLLDNISNGEGGPSWSFGKQLTVTAAESMQFVRLTKSADMRVDFGDVRFVGNTSSNSVFFEYELLTSDATYLYYKVAVPFSYTIGSTFYAIWGNPDAIYKGNAQRVAFASAWLTNNFNRTPKYDVCNVFRSYDYLLDGPGTGTIEANWPCKTQNPIFQTAWGKPTDDDWLPVYVGYKYDPIDFIHAGSPTTKSALKYSLDFGETWSARQYIYDPDDGYYGTSSTSIDIPTSGTTPIVITTQAGLNYQNGQVVRVFNDSSHYFWATVTSYSGTSLTVTRLSNTGTGTFTSWHISQKYGATNTVITSVKMPNGIIRLVAAFTIVNFYDTEGGSSFIDRVYASYSDLTNGVPGAWSDPVMISDNNWSNVGGQACTTHDGIVWMTYHQDKVTTPTYSSNVAYSRDYGITWDRIKVDSPGLEYLNETDLLPLYDDNLNPINAIRATCRNETAPSHQYVYEITWDDDSVSASAAVENNWYDSTVSRYTSVRCPDKKTVFWAGGDATEKMIWSQDNLDSFNEVPFATLTTAGVSARRVYTVMAVHPDGRMLKIWASNKQPAGSDLFINYWDWTLNQLYCDTSLTLTDATGTHNRPRDLSPGIRIGEFLTGYRTTSTTSISVPTGAGQQRTLTVASGLNWAPGDVGCCVFTTNTVRFTFTVISYSGTQLVVEWLSNTGTGTQANWILNLGIADNTGNLLSNQSYLTIPRRNANGQSRPFRRTIRMGSYGTGLVTGGFWGSKKFETRATAVVTITNAGSAGDTITINWAKSSTYTGLFGGLGPLAEYTVQPGDNISAVVAGLVANANLKGVSPVVSSTGTTLTLMAPFGNNTAINGQSLTVSATGTVAGSSGTFSGGAAIESSTASQNVFVVDNSNNVVRIEQANDNYSAAFTVTDGPVDYVYEVDNVDDNVTNGITSRTKLSSDGSGILNFEDQAILFLSTSPSSVQGLLDCYKIMREPLNQTIPTEAGGTIEGSWTEREDGLALG